MLSLHFFHKKDTGAFQNHDIMVLHQIGERKSKNFLHKLFTNYSQKNLDIALKSWYNSIREVKREENRKLFSYSLCKLFTNYSQKNLDKRLKKWYNSITEVERGGKTEKIVYKLFTEKP